MNQLPSVPLRAAALAALLVPALAAAGDGISYGGSSTLADTVLKGGAIQAFEGKTGARFAVVDVSGTGKGLKALADGKLNLVGAGRTLAADEKKAGLLGTVIGYDGLAVYVNKANAVKNLTRAQLKDVFTGKVKSWKELGGKDVPVVPLVEPIASKRATVQLFQELVLDGVPFKTGIRELEQLSDQMREVASTEGAICVASVGFLGSAEASLKGAVRAVSLDDLDPSDANIRSGAYLLSRPMLFVTKGLPEGDPKKFIEFMLSKDGQAIVERFFVSVRK
jgi:phosphate transport system substrate-binding protein